MSGKLNLTKPQQDFILEKTKGLDLLCITLHGSTLYGLDHPDSDIDMIAVYLPSKTDLVFGNNCKTSKYKDEENNIELEIKSIQSFITSLGKCDTNCLDMIHTPDYLTFYNTSLWKNIKALRKCVYAKNMKGIIGYIKTHTHKYSNKIQRLQELCELEKYLNDFKTTVDISNYRLKDSSIDSWVEYKKFEYIKLGVMYGDHEQSFLEVCGKKYTMTWSLSTVLDAVQSEIQRYGQRTNSGRGTGYDTKALSHALRSLVQVEDLVTNHNISFPLMEVDLVRKVKFNKMSLEDVMDLLEVRFTKVNTLLDKSNLPEFNDITPITNLLEEYYFGN
jgi:hypothetical protein